VSAPQRMELAIERDYRGNALPESQRVQLSLQRTAAAWVVELDAPYFGDPAPSGPAGSHDRLWEHEVCEVFIADDAEHYLEIELSPHGHYLVLELNGVRQVVRSGLPIAYRVQIDRDRVRGRAEVPCAYGPQDPTRVNAYAIHGVGDQRRYCAHAPPLGAAPDFHRLACFVPLQLA
jgi:hypothetical protein